MRPLHAAFNWIRQLVLRRRVEHEMQMEMQSHIEQQAALNHARGMSEREAMYEARREFGNVGNLQEESRDARGVRLIEETARDVRYGLRALRRTPLFTIVALLSLTLGIGVNTAMFTLMRYVNAPPPVSDPSTFVTLPYAITYPTWRAFATEQGLFSKTVAQARTSVAIARPGLVALEAKVHLVSDGFFSFFDTQPLIGRLLVAGEEHDAGGVPAAVLSYAFWQREFGADSAIIGKPLRLTNGSLFTIVGVTTVQFAGPDIRMPDFWVPLSARRLLPASAAGIPLDFADDRTSQWLSFAARLAPGVSLAQARMRVSRLVAHAGNADSVLAPDMAIRLQGGSDSGLNVNNVATAALIFSATFMVLLIGCANVANLVLARGIRRRREIAVRMSLGAGRMRLIRQLTTECLILSIVGGTLALVLSAVLLRAVATSGFAARVLPAAGQTLVAQLQLTTNTVVFTYAVAIVSAFACGLFPALRSTRMDLSRAARDHDAAVGTRQSGSKLRAALVIGQIACSLALLTTASLLVRSAAESGVMNAGFDRAHVAIARIGGSATGYSQAQMKHYRDGLETRLASLVGESNVARGTIPLTSWDRLRVDAKLPTRFQGIRIRSSEHYFRVMGIDVKSGRAFTREEARNEAPVVVIGESLARHRWPDSSPIGQHIEIAESPYAYPGEEEKLRNVRDVVVIGVASDANFLRLNYSGNLLIYVPSVEGDFVVKSASPDRIVNAMRDAGRIEDSNVLLNVSTMDNHIASEEGVIITRIVAAYAGGMGFFALVLSLIGIVGVVGYAVSQRTREIGVRLALGAQRTDVLAMVVGQGLRPVFYGATLGLLIAAAASRALSSMLFGVSSLDPLAYLSATAAVAIAAVLACYFPARRAMQVDPVGALRAD